MKNILLPIILATSLNAEVIRRDKVQHIALGLVSYGVCVGIGELFEQRQLNSKTCVLAAVGAGLIKEGYDATGRGVVEWDN